ncbi:hypothetical protein [Streptomyces sp. NPDC004296]|uniref:MmyB family transcriptional regulator n=1 Tax=Streptomyces sp. NPDC004296 TaxID=3364697 RepID=UPI0036B3C6EF
MDQLLSEAPETRRNSGTYGRLERGVLNKPAAEYLRGIARILQFSEQEWVSFFSYARGEYPPFLLYTDAVITVSDLCGDPTTTIEYLADFAGNILAFSSGFAALFPDGLIPANIYHYVLFDERARGELCPDWESTWGPLTVADLRAAVARHRHNATLGMLSTRVRADTRTRALLTAIPTGVAAGSGEQRELVHPALGRGWVTVGDPLSSPGAHISRHSWHFRTRTQPQPQPTLLTLADRDPAGFVPAAEIPEIPSIDADVIPLPRCRGMRTPSQ